MDRLLGLGAARADIGQGDVPWIVLADPEGNEFCVLDPRPVYQGIAPVAAVVADCRDPAAVAGFWRLATGWVPGNSVERLSGVSLRSPARSRAVPGAGAVRGHQDGQEPGAPGRGSRAGRGSRGRGRGAAVG